MHIQLFADELTYIVSITSVNSKAFCDLINLAEIQAAKNKIHRNMFK